MSDPALQGDEEAFAYHDNIADLTDEGTDHFITRINLQYGYKKTTPKLIGRFLMGDMVGNGSFGKVKEGLDMSNARRVAIKIMKQKKLRKIASGEQSVKTEIEILKQVNHRNVIELIEVLVNREKQKMYMVLEYCTGVLQKMLDRAEGNRFPPWQAHDYFTQIMCGLDYLHGRGIVHKDIKPGNLLLTYDETLKITDFGTGQILGLHDDHTIKSANGTPAFQAPEVAKGCETFSGFKIDIWASGVTLYNFVTGEYPFEGDNVFQLYENIEKGEFTIPDELDDLLRDLLAGVLDPNPDRRFRLESIRLHPWVRMEVVQGKWRVPIRPCPLPTHPNGNSGDTNHKESCPHPPDTTLLPFLDRLYNPSENRGSSQSIESEGIFGSHDLLQVEPSELDPEDTSVDDTGSVSTVKRPAVEKFKNENHCRIS